MHISFTRVYQYKHITFEFHQWLGPLFLRRKDHEAKNNQYRPMRDYALLYKWIRMSEEEQERYRIA